MESPRNGGEIMEPISQGPEPIRAGRQVSQGRVRPDLSTADMGRGAAPQNRAGSSDIKRWSGTTWTKILGAAALVLGGWYYMGNAHTATITGTEQGPYKQHQQATASMVSGLGMADMDGALTQIAPVAARMGQPVPNLSNPTPKLLDAIRKGDVKFYRVRIYDTCEEDGDFVTIESDSGVSYPSFMLTNAGRMLTIPVIGNTPPKVTMTGIKDGVGGITAGVVTSTGVWYSKILAPGESEPIHFEFR